MDEWYNSIQYFKTHQGHVSNIPDMSSRLLNGGRVIRPGVVIYLLALFIELFDMLGNTYL